MQEVATWVAALAGLIGFGLAMGLNPALYGATADMLARKVPVRARLLWMVGGLAVGATILLVIFRTINPAAIVSASQGELDAVLVNLVVDVLAGVVFLLAAAAVLWWKARRPVLASTKTKPTKPRDHPSSYFLLGLGACIGFTTLPIMYLTGRLISGLTDDLALRSGAYGIFLIAMAAPFFALAWVWMRFPRLTDHITDFYTRALRWDYRRLLAGVLVGASLLFFGLALFAHRAG